MPSLALPHTPGCLACGRENPHGLRLELAVDDGGVVTTAFTPGPHHIGFVGVAHGGVQAVVLDEAMVWAASWAGKRFCYCGELAIRYRRPARVGVPLAVTAKVDVHRSKLLTTSATITDADGNVVATATAKYVPLPGDENRAFVALLVDEPGSHDAFVQLRMRSTTA
ncbi:MAG TPA: PaaI family thioesterase [Tepidisphaeraceae bacterium]|nr:PaaI family thioesterase [Tepidisphaeraceae bacterium]